MADEKTRKQALALLDQMVAEADAEEWLMAIAYVVITTNGETFDVHVNGLFHTIEAAEDWAAAHQAALNTGNPENELPFVVKIYPVVPTS